MKSTAKKKIFINNMITLGMVVAAWIIMEVLMGTGHVSSLLKGLLVPFCIYVIMAVSLNLTVGILGELSLGHAGFMGLSPIYVNEVFDIIQSINRDGVTVLLVEQNAKKALSIANQAYVLETGKIVLSGDAKQLMNDEKVKKAYLSE